MEDSQDPTVSVEPSAAPSASVSETDRRFRQLYGLIAFSLLGVLVLSTAVNVFVWRQLRMVRRQLEDSRRTVAEFHRTGEPAIKDILLRLESFAATNRDYQQILRKYAPPPPKQTNAAATAPKPAAK